MRHYEIVASGAVPFFDEDPTRAPSSTLAFWPKKLLRDLRTWPGVYYQNGTVDVDALDASGAYSKLAAGLLTYLRERLTTEALARYILETMGQAKARNVLILSAHPAPDFLRESVVHGFRQRGLERKRSTLSSPFTYTSRASRRPSTRRRGPNCMATASPTPIALRDDPRVDRSDVVKKLREPLFSTSWSTRRCTAVCPTLTSCGAVKCYAWMTRSPSSTARTSTPNRWPLARCTAWPACWAAAVTTGHVELEQLPHAGGDLEPGSGPPDIEVGEGLSLLLRRLCVFLGGSADFRAVKRPCVSSCLWAPLRWPNRQFD